jgi:hypothetical protein
MTIPVVSIKNISGDTIDVGNIRLHDGYQRALEPFDKLTLSANNNFQSALEDGYIEILYDGEVVSTETALAIINHHVYVEVEGEPLGYAHRINISGVLGGAVGNMSAGRADVEVGAGEVGSQVTSIQNELDGYAADEIVQNILVSLDGYYNVIDGYDEKVKISENDTTPGYLTEKLQAGKNVIFQQANTGGDESLSIKSTCYEDLIYEPTGFTNDVRSTISFVDVTRTFTIAPTGTSFEYYIRGDGYSKTSAESVVIPDESGNWYIYYDGPTLVYSRESWDLSVHVPVAILYWSADDNKHIIFGEERHKLTMDWATHARMHLAVGAVKRRYTLDLINYTLRGNGTQDTHAQVGYENGSIHDEDLIHNIVHNDTPTSSFEQYLRTYAKIPMYYKDGADGYWKKLDATDFPVIHDSPNLVKYNKYDSGTWSLENCADSCYVCTWVCGTNNIYEPIIGIVGQQQSTSYIGAATEDFNTLANGLPFAEFVLLDKLIFRTSTGYTNTPKATLYSKNGEIFGEGTTSIVGSLTRLTFGFDSSAGDKWINYEHYNVNTYDVPGVIAYKIEIRGVTFSNKKDDASVDIEFYVNGTSQSKKVYTLEVRDKQWVYDSDIDPIILNPGDLIRCYVRKVDVDADSPVVQLEGKVIDATTLSGSG